MARKKKKNKNKMTMEQQLAALTNRQQQDQATHAALIQKAMGSNDPEVYMAGQKAWRDIQPRQEGGQQTMLIDPMQLNGSMGYKDRPVAMSYHTMRTMAKTPIISAIIGTRIDQIASFSEPQESKYSIGFKIRKKGMANPEDESKLSKEDRAKIDELTEFILNCGNTQNTWHGDSFEGFLRKYVRDSQELDQSTFEVIRDRRGMPVEFFATDAATHRVADTYDDEMKGGGPLMQDPTRQQIQTGVYGHHSKKKTMGYLPSHVQVYQGQVCAEYYPWELNFGVRNPSTSIYRNGYGHSELETLINIVTWQLFGDVYNGKFFSQGASPKGILKVSGHVNQNRLAEFRQNWMAQIQGVSNAWKTPVIESENMEWIDLQKSNTDMQFQEWQAYLTNVCCACYKIDPSEIGMEGNAQSSGAMFESGKEAQLKYSKDKGVRPNLRFVQRQINKWLINALAPGYEFVFVGLDQESEKDELDMLVTKVANGMSLKEFRKALKLSPNIAEDDMTLNSVYAQILAQRQQKEMMEQQNEAVENDVDEDEEDGFAVDDYENTESSSLVDEITDESENPLYKSFVDMLKKGEFNQMPA